MPITSQKLISARQDELVYQYLKENAIPSKKIELLGQDKFNLLSRHLAGLIMLKASVEIQALIDLNLPKLQMCLRYYNSVILLRRYDMSLTDIIMLGKEKLKLLLDRRNAYALESLKEYFNEILAADVLVLGQCLKYYEVIYFLSSDVPLKKIMAIDEDKFALLSSNLFRLYDLKRPVKEGKTYMVPASLRVNKNRFFHSPLIQESFFLQDLIDLDYVKLKQYFKCSFVINCLMSEDVSLEEALELEQKKLSL